MASISAAFSVTDKGRPGPLGRLADGLYYRRPDYAARWSTPDLLFVLAYALGGGGLLALWQRAPSILDRLWAEDGTIFLQQAVTEPFGVSLTADYAGYLHVVPRILAESVSLLPVPFWAFGMAAAAIAVRILLGIALYVALDQWLVSRFARAVIAIAFLLIPAGAAEVLNNVANLQWFLLPLCAIALLGRGLSYGRLIAGALIVAAAALSSPVAFALAPLVVLRFVFLRSIREQIVSIVYVVGVSAQLIAVLHSSGRSGSGGISAGSIAGTYLTNVVLGQPFGIEPARALFQLMGWTVVALCCLLIVIYLAGPILRREPRALLLVALVVTSVVLHAVCTTFLTSVPSLDPANLYIGGRYSVGPIILLSIGVGVALAWNLESASSRRSRRIARVLASVAGSLILVAFVPAYIQGYASGWRPGEVPSWRQAVAQARTECDAGSSTSPVLPISPGGERWVITIACATLAR